MKVDLYEKIWMYGVGLMLALFFGSTAAAAFGRQMHPPSHIETIDPKTLLTDARFSRQGPSVDGEGRFRAVVVGLMFAWLPQDMTLPADTPVTFRLSSMDVIHGFEIVRTNGQTMVVPGYVSQFTTQFPAGEYLVVCNEYCGVGHHLMSGKLHVVPRDQWKDPASAAAAAMVTPDSASGGAGHDSAEASHDH
jgi:cytochrome c oxidase subunit 2